MKTLLFSVIALLLVGCASPGKKLSGVSTGMTKSEVISILGKPTSVSASGAVELLNYSLNANRALFTTDWDDYFVRLVNGRVESYGRRGDLQGTNSRDDKK